MVEGSMFWNLSFFDDGKLLSYSILHPNIKHRCFIIWDVDGSHLKTINLTCNWERDDMILATFPDGNFAFFHGQILWYLEPKRYFARRHFDSVIFWSR